MSGVEVVGLVLGAIPLVISGLEHYAEGVETIKVIRNCKDEFKAVAWRLEAENRIFHNTIEILLSECVHGDKQQILMRDVGKASWEEQEVRVALEDRLLDSYKPFVQHVASINRSLNEFRRRLDIGADGKGPFDNPKSFRQTYKRLGFALKRSEYQDLIKEIHSDNTQLLTLTKQSRTIQSRRRQVRRAPNFDAIKSNASGVFQSLKKALSCGASHKASVCLKQPPQSDHGLEGLRIVLHHIAANPKQKAFSWSVEEAEVRLVDLQTPTLNASVSTSSASKKSVRFQTSGPSPAAPILLAQQQQQQTLKEIMDLCNSLGAWKSTQCGRCLGYMVAGHSSHRHGLYWPEKRLVDGSGLSLQTLDNILEKKSNVSSSSAAIGSMRARITNGDAHQMAVSLASGVLQLHDTPWLSSLSKADVTLVCQNGKWLAEYPFISRHLEALASSNATSADRKPASSRIIRNQTLFSLGVLLIELCMRKPIDELHEPDELNPDGTEMDLSDYYTATRLVDSGEILDQFGERWSEVVRRCIYCDLNLKDPRLENPEFQAAVYNEIFAELEEDRRQWFKLP